MARYDDDERDDDLDDDRPPRRRRRPDEDDDYDDDRPRPRRRPPQKKGGGVGVTLIVVGVVALLVCCGGGGFGIFFAVQKVREAAARTVETNNFKQIAVGSLNHHDFQRQLPPADGPVSWRVHILPYIEQESLYRQFNTNEPWDGPTNKRHAGVQIKTYTSPHDPQGTTDTRYRVFVGEGTLYPPGVRPVHLGEITDGTANTIFAIEAQDAVPWPQPRELTYSPNGPLPAVGRKDADTVMMAFTDGSVRTVRRKNLDDKALRALITPRANDVVPPLD
jgi:hypothetical protein